MENVLPRTQLYRQSARLRCGPGEPGGLSPGTDVGAATPEDRRADALAASSGEIAPGRRYPPVRVHGGHRTGQGPVDEGTLPACAAGRALGRVGSPSARTAEIGRAHV